MNDRSPWSGVLHTVLYSLGAVVGTWSVRTGRWWIILVIVALWLALTIVAWLFDRHDDPFRESHW